MSSPEQIVTRQIGPRIIAALHLPDPVREPGLSMHHLEDYILANAGVFVAAGITTIKLQDQTRCVGPASILTIATMASLGRLLRREYPMVELGIILQAHDGEGPLAVARACGASFVRLKVFAGSVSGAEGPKHGLGVQARAYRQQTGATHVAILADVHDRTTLPIDGATLEQTAQWVDSMGADSLVITGSSFAESLARIKAVRGAGVLKPVIIGGGVTADNVGEALRHADGVVVSTALMSKPADRKGHVIWDIGLCQRFMDAARSSQSAHP